MIVLASIIAGTVVGMTVVIVQLCKAPVGYEDVSGFHIIQRVKGSAVLRYPKSKNPVAAGLESAEVHS